MIVRATHIQDFQFKLESAQFKLLSDQSLSFGGNAQGPVPTELLLWSIASCFAQTIHFVACRMRKTLSGLVVEVEGTKNTRAQRFQTIRIDVSANCPTDELKKMVSTAKGYCYVTRSLSPEVHLEMNAVAGDVLKKAL